MTVPPPGAFSHTAQIDRQALVAGSIELIERLQDPTGAYPASPTFSAYAGYSWFRDGAFIADAMSSAGRVASAERFFDWCAGVIVSRSAQIGRIAAAAQAGRPLADSEMLPTRFTFDGRDGDDDWWDFQLDGYGTWIWAVGAHVARHNADPGRWAEAIGLTLDYLAASWQRPCFDWWEEHSEHVHISTLGCLVAGARAAAALPVLGAEHRQVAETLAGEIDAAIAARGVSAAGLGRAPHLVKWVGSSAVDASLAAVVGVMDVVPAASALGLATISAIETDLAVDGGVHRFVDDTYFGGGQWPLLSCFLGLAQLRAGDRGRAEQLLDWAGATVDADGAMPEQVEDHLLAPDRLEEWVTRWGPSARPLLWSHAMYIRLAVDLGRPSAREEHSA
ncbi:glycosyl hydrolase family 15 [Microbacterium sp. SLBN-154]|uniref:glycoside hydrolase family 15 protein n=1 Tax=Microbacterium sp. SLBN-154 TaxID=2768458 RepID=UPI001151A7CB|nr:glycoside hydrolase family 15 protein [Microbacterium sp. SLBN-154]TQK18649.1 glycosyl hydrolase family 15 [Microbacterium sp. SLBN-154]